MPATDPYTALRPDLTGRPPVDTPAFPPGHPDAPPQVAPAPPGAVWTMLPNGDRALAYLPPGYEKTTEPTPAAPAERDKWPLRMATGGGATAAVIGVIGHYGHGINQAGHGIGMAFLGIAAATATVGIAVSAIKGSTTKRNPVNVTVNNNISPSFSANSRSTSSNRGR
ncbi:hypothetical protein OG552_10585 [Streptomyces sp. NBC_01476]|uniref:hypothetical protein n=1 Tax=Streptomyces sp. NBC_01476 TaxID=2903881 RepID=UPI002E340C8A|nr:hypothetical protein [Streptomyces sp. NBC_01476]